MDLVPAVVTSELADAALASPVLADAIKLAEWIGAGKEVTGSGVLRPAVATAACELLGIELPEGKIRSAADIEPLEVAWEVAQRAGLVTVGSKHVRAADLPDGPERALRCWLRVASVPLGFPDEPCAECVTILALLTDAPEPVILLELIETVLSDLPSGDEDENEELLGHVTRTVVALRDLNAISVTELGDPGQHTLRLTPLGRLLAGTVFTALTLAPGEMAGLVVRRLGEFTPRIAARIAGPWLAGRTAVDVAEEMLDFAAYARADLRLIATAFVNSLGAEAAPAWRERVRERGVGVYARAWLAEHGENVPMDGREADWMRIEEFSARMAVLPPPLLAALLANLGAADPGALPELRRVLNRSRHPDAPKLIDAIGQATGRPTVIARRDPPPAPSTVTGTTYRIRISLRHVEKPDVWRLVAVDAGTTLAELHQIIQAAMGWSDEHLHSFDDDGVDEAAPLGRLLRKPGDSILYTYDFGDDWEHDVILAAVDHNDSGASLPAMLDGCGACPPEDCGGAPGYRRLKEVMADPRHSERDEMAGWLGAGSFDPAGFSLAGAAAVMDAAVIDAGSGLAGERRPVAVVRSQPRRRKRRR